MTTPVGSVRITAEADAGDFGDDLVKVVKEAMSEVIKGVLSGMREVNGALADVDGSGFTDLSEEAQAAARRFADVEAALEEVAAAISDIDPDELAELSRTAARAASEVENVGDAARGMGADLAREARSAADDVARIGDGVTESRSAFGRLGDAMRGAASDISNAAKGAASDLGNYFKQAASDVKDSMKSAGEAAEGALDQIDGKAAAVAGVVGGLALGDLIATSIEQADLPGRLGAQLDLTTAEAQRASDITKNIFAEGYGESMEQVSGAVQNVASSIGNLANTSDADFQLITKGALNLESLFGIDMQESVTALQAAINNGLAKDGVQAMDLLTAAAQKMPPALAQELPSIVEEYSTFFGQLGFDGPEAFGALVAASDNGRLSMDKVGDSLKEFTLLAGDLGNTTAVAALDQLGLAGANVQDRLAAGGATAKGAFDDVVNAINKMPEGAAKAQAAIDLFGTPLEDLGRENIPDFIAGLANADTALGDFAGKTAEVDKSSAGVGQNLTSLGRTIKQDLVDAIAPAVEAIAHFVAENEGLVKGVVETAVAITGFIVAAKGISAVVGGVKTGIGILKELGPIAKIIGGPLVKGLQLMATGIRLVGLAIAANPIGLLITAIAALVAGLVYFFTQTETGRKLLSEFFDWLGGVWDTIKEAWSDAIEWISGVWDDIVEGAGKLKDWFVELPGKIGEWIGDLAGSIGNWFSEQWTAFTEFVGTTVEGWIDFWTGLPGKIIGWIGDLAGSIGTWFAEQWENFKLGLGIVIDTAAEFFTGLPGKIVGWVGDLASAIGGWFSEQWSNFKLGLGIVIDSVAEFFTSFVGKIVGWVGDLASGIGGWFAEQWDNFKRGLGIVIDTASSFFTGLPGKILGWLGNAGTWLLDTGKNIINGLIDGLRNAGSAVKDFLIGLMKDAKDAVLGFFGIKSPSRVFAEIGKNLMQGMSQGIDRNGDLVTGALSDVAAAVADTTFEAPSITASVAQPEFGAAGESAAGLDPEVFAAFGEAATVTAEEQVAPALLAMTDGLTLTGDTAVAVTNEQVAPSLAFIGEQAQLLAETMGVAINDGMIPAAQSLGDAIQRTQAEGIQPAFNAIQGGLQTVQGAFQTGVQAIGATWDQLKQKTDAPVRFTVDQVFNRGLVGVWNHVSDFIGTEKMGTFSYAAGGVTPGWSPGRDIHKFISPTGGRLELSGGEAIMVPEFTAAMGPDWIYRMNRLARSRGVRAVRDAMNSFGDGPQVKFADGGVWQSLWAAVNNKFPGTFQLTSAYRDSADYHGQGKAIDVSNGTDDTPQMQMLAQWIFQNFGRAALELIHSPFPHNVKDGRDVGDGFGFYGADTMSQHRNHVHWAANGVSPGAGGPAYGPAYSMSDVVKEMAAEKWKEVEPAIKEFANSTAGMIAKTPLHSYETVRKVTDAKIEELAKKFDVPAGEGVERFRPLVNSLLANYGHPASWADSTLRRMMQESGGNQNAVNDYDINAQNGTPSVGLMQVIGPTYQAWKDAKFDTGPYLHNVSTAPPANISASMRYTMNRYGSLPGGYDQAGGYFMGGVLPLFDQGGVMTGPGIFASGTTQPERILSPGQTAAFDKFVDWLTGGRMTVDWQGVEGMIREGIRVYQEESKRNREQQEQNTDATKDLNKQLGGGGTGGSGLAGAVAAAAELSGDLMSVLDTSGLFAGRTITLTAEEVRQKQIEEWKAFLERLRSEHDKHQQSQPSGGKTFDLGGVLSGPGMFASGTVLPERVLSPRQTQAFERLVAAIAGPMLGVPDLRGSDGRSHQMGPRMTAGDINFTINESRSARATGKVVQDHLLDLLDR